MPDLSADLSGVQGFADQLDTLRQQLDLSGQTVSGSGAADGDPQVADGLQTFGGACTHAQTVIDSYLVALSGMARQTVTVLKAADAQLAKQAKPVPVHSGRMIAD